MHYYCYSSKVIFTSFLVNIFLSFVECCFFQIIIIMIIIVIIIIIIIIIMILILILILLLQTIIIIIIMIIIIMNLHRDMGKLEANETNVVENCVYKNQIRDPNASLERIECQEKSEIKNLILRKWEIVRELPICERPPKSEILNSQFSSVFTKEDRENNPKMGSGPKPGLRPLITEIIVEKFLLPFCYTIESIETALYPLSYNQSTVVIYH